MILKNNEKDVQFLAEIIDYYLSKTLEKYSDWDIEHLAVNLINELEIKKRLNDKR